MIPEEILPYVFQELNYHDLLHCSLVCKSWYRLTFDPFLKEQWKDINFQEKLQQLEKRYIRESTPVASRIKKEEKMNWVHLYRNIIHRSRNNLRYIKLWSSFNSSQITILMNNGKNYLQNLSILDLRGTNFDITFLFKNCNEIMEKESTLNKAIVPTSTTTTIINNNSNIYFLDLFKNLQYLFIYGCKNMTKENLQKLHEQWNKLYFDVKICPECQEISRICREKALNSIIADLDFNLNDTKLKEYIQCQVCKKSYCDKCRPLWTCEECGGKYTCYDCRAHGLRCTTCDTDYCYTCNNPTKVLECRYCHSVCCGKSIKCQNLGYLYKSCEKCDHYVCHHCVKEEKNSLLVCSGKDCKKCFCKTCIDETTESPLISFDREEVERRIYENNFALCSYCNKLYCTDCINNNISFYVGNKEFSCAIVLCKECESFYQTQLLNLFRMQHLNLSDYDDTNTNYNNDGLYANRSSTTTYSNNIIAINSTNLLTNRSISIENPIDIYNDHHYIR